MTCTVCIWVICRNTVHCDEKDTRSNCIHGWTMYSSRNITPAHLSSISDFSLWNSLSPSLTFVIRNCSFKYSTLRREHTWYRITRLISQTYTLMSHIASNKKLKPIIYNGLPFNWYTVLFNCWNIVHGILWVVRSLLWLASISWFQVHQLLALYSDTLIWDSINSQVEANSWSFMSM